MKIIASGFDRMAADRYWLYVACCVAAAAVVAAVEIAIYVTLTRMGAF